MKVDQPRGGGGGGGAVDPRETESMAWPLLLRVCADIVEFLLNFRPLFERSFFFFFLLLFQRTEKSLLIPSWKTNSLSLLPGVLLRHLLNFFWSKGHSIFRFFFLKFSFLFYSVEKEGKIFEKGEKCLFYLL